jgi:hypothetical protein
MMRDKYMAYEEFVSIQKFDWSPVCVAGDAKSSWTKNIPPAVLNSVFASGSSASGISIYDRVKGSAFVVGGIENIRNAPDDPVPFNKDCYNVISGWNSSGLVVQGPYKDHEHWLSGIPARFHGVPTIGT